MIFRAARTVRDAPPRPALSLRGATYDLSWSGMNSESDVGFRRCSRPFGRLHLRVGIAKLWRKRRPDQNE